MAFQIQCDSCDKTFAIPDEVYERRVVGKVVTIRCKNCKAAIRIDGRKKRPVTPPDELSWRSPEGEALSAKAAPAAAGARAKTGPEPEQTAATTHGGFSVVSNPVTRKEPPERSVTPPASPLSKAARSQQRAAAVQPAAPSEEAELGTEQQQEEEEDELWAVDYDEAEDRELTTAEIGAELERRALSADTLVWRIGMHDWAPISEVPELGQLVPELVREVPKPPAPQPLGRLQGDPLRTTKEDTPVAKAQPRLAQDFSAPKPAATAALPPMRPRALTQPGIGLADIEELSARPDPASDAPPPPEIPRQPAPKTEQALPPPPPPRRASSPNAATEPASFMEPKQPSAPEAAPNPFAGFAPWEKPAPPPPPLPPNARGAERSEPTAGMAPVAPEPPAAAPAPPLAQAPTPLAPTPTAPGPMAERPSEGAPDGEVVPLAPPLQAADPFGGVMPSPMGPSATAILPDDMDFGKPRRRGVVVLVLGAAVVVAAVIWLVSTSNEEASAPTPPTTPAASEPAATSPTGMDSERTATSPAPDEAPEPATPSRTADEPSPQSAETSPASTSASEPRSRSFAEMFAEGAKGRQTKQTPKR